jgi:DNA-binding SARP family transcriptional activator/tetratricopeptide (TPR) repeat protein
MLAGDEQILLLGPIELFWSGRRLSVGGRPGELLAILALTPQRTVSYDSLCDAIWDDRPPVHPRGSLHSLVSRVRSLVGADLIAHTSGGYLLQMPEDHIDLFRFRGLVARARLVGQRPENADAELGLLNDALRLWRGPAFANVNSRQLRLYQVPRITEEWLSAVERRQDLELAAGRHGELIAEMQELTVKYPFREPLWARLIIALYRAGRQGEAFAAYGDICARLCEELGADPGADLILAHELILGGSPGRAIGVALDAVRAAAPAAEPTYPPRELPADLRYFVGRHADLAKLDGLVAQRSREPGSGPGIAVIDGSAGIGKTALAIHWSNRVVESFPDGQLYLNLRGFGPVPPVDVNSALHALLGALGLAANEIPADTTAASGLLRSRTAGKRILVLLDNASNTDQVRALLPGPGCLALVTSRNQLRGLVARDAAVRISLSALDADESAHLLAEIAGGDRVGTEPEAAARLAELCDRIPLALRILAERIARQPATRLVEFVDDLLERQDRLDSFDAHDDAGTNLRTVLSWSYAGLDAATARTFRLVGGLHPGGDISLAAAAAAAGVPVTVARIHLDRLAATHLVEQHRRDRYQLHDLVRAFAAEQTRRYDGRAQRDEAVRRVLDWYLHTADHADRLMEPHRLREPLDAPCDGVAAPAFNDQREAFGWYDIEYATLITLPAWAFAAGAYMHACQLTYRLQYFMGWYHARYHDLLAVHEVALDAAIKLQDFRMQGHLLSAMGIANADLNRRAEADRCHQRALAAFREAGDGHGEAKVLGNAASLDAERGEYVLARQRCEQALELSTRLGRERGRSLNLDTLGEIHFGCGEYVSAIACWRRALEINRRAGSRWSQVVNITNLGRAYAALGRYQRAIRYYQQAVSLGGDLSSPRSQAFPLLNLGRAHRASGDLTAARRSWREALAILEDLTDLRAEEVRMELAAVEPGEAPHSTAAS